MKNFLLVRFDFFITFLFNPRTSVMYIISFPEDAESLLSKNLESAEQNLKQIGFDLDYLRDQMTNTEVGTEGREGDIFFI